MKKIAIRETRGDTVMVNKEDCPRGFSASCHSASGACDGYAGESGDFVLCKFGYDPGMSDEQELMCELAEDVKWLAEHTGLSHEVAARIAHTVHCDMAAEKQEELLEALVNAAGSIDAGN